MPKQSPVPDELTQPFFDACNEDRLVVQRCNECTERAGLLVLQQPPAETCNRCGGSNIEWHEVSGRGRIQSYVTMYDTPVASLQEDQPFNIAVIELWEDKNALFLSHLPGTPVREVPMGAEVRVVFEVTPANGQKVAEWEVVGD